MQISDTNKDVALSYFDTVMKTPSDFDFEKRGVYKENDVLVLHGTIKIEVWKQRTNYHVIFFVDVHHKILGLVYPNRFFNVFFRLFMSKVNIRRTELCIALYHYHKVTVPNMDISKKIEPISNSAKFDAI